MAFPAQQKTPDKWARVGLGETLSTGLHDERKGERERENGGLETRLTVPLARFVRSSSATTGGQWENQVPPLPHPHTPRSSSFFPDCVSSSFSIPFCPPCSCSSFPFLSFVFMFRRISSSTTFFLSYLFFYLFYILPSFFSSLAPPALLSNNHPRVL